MRRSLLLTCSALFSIALIAQPAFADSMLDTTTAPQVKGDLATFATTPDASKMSQKQVIDLIRKKVKYVFVIYQENRSFDSYFGTFPGADGIYSQPAADTPGFTQAITDTNGAADTIQPFLIGPALYAEDTDDLDHSHARLATKIDVQGSAPAKMDLFAVTEELKYSPTGNPSQKAKGYGELAMAHVDCNTIPLLWNYANRFVLFDHMFQDVTGPSTPGNLTIFAAQSGETQLALHPSEAVGNNYVSGTGEPVFNDDNPLAGSVHDPIQPPLTPRNPGDGATGQQINQTYATLAVSMAGKTLEQVTTTDENPTADLADIQDDIAYETKGGKVSVPWAWYEEGYDQEVTDPTDPMTAGGTHASYVTHHNGPQYFGYVADNPAETANLHGLGDFFGAISAQTLPKQGGLFYLKGGYTNLFGLTPVNPLAVVQTNFKGDDDHPAYSDAEISEALVAKEVNAIAQSPYWSQSAIIITWDDSEGDYDHVPPPIIRDDQGNTPLPSTFGPRVPLIVISPYAKVHQIASQVSSQSSVVKFIGEVFGRDPLATLPDEKKGFKLGQTEFGNKYEGPLDTYAGISDLTSAFDPNRLDGKAPVLPASFVEIPDSVVTSLPHYNGKGCAVLGIEPEDYVKGIVNNIPADFNTLPGTSPNTIEPPPS
jgi:phospholipase C